MGPPAPGAPEEVTDVEGGVCIRDAVCPGEWEREVVALAPEGQLCEGRVPGPHSGEGAHQWLRPAGIPAASPAPVERVWALRVTCAMGPDPPCTCSNLGEPTCTRRSLARWG